MFSVIPLHKNATEKSYNFIKKETLVRVFSCEFWEISKNTFSHRTPPVAASENYRPIFTHSLCFQKAVQW